MKGLLLGSDEIVAEWAYKLYNLYPLPVNKALGILDGTKLIGACLFQNYNGVNIELSYYGPRTLTLGIVRFIATTALTDFNVARLTVVTSQRNKRLVRSCLKIGFKVEGTQRRFYGHDDSKRNTAVRLVAFKADLEKVAQLNKKN